MNAPANPRALPSDDASRGPGSPGGCCPGHKTGTHRRVRYHDVIAYKERIDAQRRKALDELAAQAQDLNMGY